MHAHHQTGTTDMVRGREASLASTRNQIHSGKSQDHITMKNMSLPEVVWISCACTRMHFDPQKRWEAYKSVKKILRQYCNSRTSRNQFKVKNSWFNTVYFELSDKSSNLAIVSRWKETISQLIRASISLKLPLFWILSTFWRFDKELGLSDKDGNFAQPALSGTKGTWQREARAFHLIAIKLAES